MQKTLKMIPLALLTVACSQSPLSALWPTPAVDSKTSGNTVQMLQNPYTSEALDILKINCSSCHGSTGGEGNVFGLDNISHMVQSGLIKVGDPNNSLIYNEIVSGGMPPSGPLTLNDQTVIQNWIKAEQSPSSTTSSPSLNSSPTYGNATFTYIKKNILQVSCTACHSGFKTYSGTMKYVVAGNPTASTLYSEILNGNMPRAGLRVSPANLKLINDWIIAGAKNN